MEPDWDMDPFLTNPKASIRKAYKFETKTVPLFGVMLTGVEHWHDDDEMNLDQSYLVVFSEEELRRLQEEIGVTLIHHASDA